MCGGKEPGGAVTEVRPRAPAWRRPDAPRLRRLHPAMGEEPNGGLCETGRTVALTVDPGIQGVRVRGWECWLRLSIEPHRTGRAARQAKSAADAARRIYAGCGVSQGDGLHLAPAEANPTGLALFGIHYSDIVGVEELDGPVLFLCRF